MDRTSYLAVPELFWAPLAIAHRYHSFCDSRLGNTPHRKVNTKEVNHWGVLFSKGSLVRKIWRVCSFIHSVSLLICNFISAIGIWLYCLDRRENTPLGMLIFMGTWSKVICIFSSLMIMCNNSSTLQKVTLQGKVSTLDSGMLVTTFSKPWLVAKKSECEHMCVCRGGKEGNLL